MTGPGRSTLRLAGILLAALAFAPAFATSGCQPLSRPFAHEGGIERDILRIPDGVGIFVEPTSSRGGAAPPGLAPAMVDALHEAEIVASSGVRVNRSSFVLTSELRRKSILWTLTGADDAIVGRHRLNLAAGDLADLDAAGDNAGPALKSQLAAAAGAIGGMIRREPPASRDLAIHVAQVEGAPGSGNIELTQAMRFVLGATSGLEIVAAPRDAISLHGTVDLQERGEDSQFIAINWRLTTQEGAEIGSIDQGNAISRGSLDGHWGEIARQIALAAAAGLTELLAQTRLP